MSDEDFEKRINNKLETIVETQANLQEAIAQLVNAARIHDSQIKANGEQIALLIEIAHTHEERLDRIEKQSEENGRQIKENSEQIAALAQQGQEQQGRIDALIRIVEGHLSNHP